MNESKKKSKISTKVNCWFNKFATMMAVSLTSSMLFTGCGASYDNASSLTMDSSSHYFTEDSWEMPEESIVTEEIFDENGYSDDAYTDDDLVETEDIDKSAVDSNRKLIKTVDLNVETKEFDTLIISIEKSVSDLGGYIEESYSYNGSHYNSYRASRNANMTIRIPKKNLSSFLDTVSGISNVVSKSERVEDVTLTYVDLESHKNALVAEESRLLELMEIAETIEDIITIEDRLTSVRYQLESMESQLRTFDNKIDYSTVCLNIDEVKELTVVEEKSGFERIADGFVDSFLSVVDGIKEFFIWFIINIPYFIVWIIAIIVIICLLKLLKRILGISREKSAERARKRAEKKAKKKAAKNIQTNCQQESQNDREYETHRESE